MGSNHPHSQKNNAININSNPNIKNSEGNTLYTAIPITKVYAKNFIFPSEIRIKL